MSAAVLALLLVFPQAPAEKLTPGTRPRVSPDGRRMAFHRFAEIPGEFGLHGQKVYKHEVWVRDLTSGGETRLIEEGGWCGWVDSNTVILADGTALAVSGKPTAVVKPPEGASIRNQAWAPGGDKLAFVPGETWSGAAGSPRKIFILERGATQPVAVDLGHAILAEGDGSLAWSPDGRRLAFHLVFFRPGNLPVRRLGVIEWPGGKARWVGEGHQYGNRGLHLSERPGDAAGTWSARGDRFAFVTGRGGDEADVYVSNADGTDVRQMTDDDETKWSPVLDPEGRRVAFCAGRVEKIREEPAEDGDRFSFFEIRKGRIRVLDLFTGRESVVTPEGAGVPSTVAWLADGSGLLFDWSGGEDDEMQIHRKLLPAPEKLEPGAPLASKPALTRKERILKALASEKGAVIEWGAGELQPPGDADLVEAVRHALRRTLKNDQSQAERALLFAVDLMSAREAAPEVIASIRSSYGPNRRLALDLAGRWKLKEATEILLKTLDKMPESETNVHAASALARLGHESGWKLLARYLEAGDKRMRGAVAYSLEGLSDPKAVPILIRLVDDAAVLYTTVEGEVQVGDHAERALATITGRTFDRRPVAWMTWWNEQEGKLPPVPSPNPALQKLDEEMKRREKEWQEKMKNR